MVYSQCLVNIKVKRPVRNTDLSAERNELSLQEYITKRSFGNVRKPGGEIQAGLDTRVLPQLSKC